MEQPAGLIGVLMDRDADIAARDDAAMVLARYDEPEVLTALITIGADSTEPDIVLESVGESIAEILLRLGRDWWQGVDDLAPTARREFDGRRSAGT